MVRTRSGSQVFPALRKADSGIRSLLSPVVAQLPFAMRARGFRRVFCRREEKTDDFSATILYRTSYKLIVYFFVTHRGNYFHGLGVMWHSIPAIIMKTLLLFLFPFAGLLAASFLATHQIPDAALVFASMFAAALTSWTLRQYDRALPALPLSRPLRLPLPARKETPAAPPQRLAA